MYKRVVQPVTAILTAAVGLTPTVTRNDAAVHGNTEALQPQRFDADRIVHLPSDEKGETVIPGNEKNTPEEKNSSDQMEVSIIDSTTSYDLITDQHNEDNRCDSSLSDHSTMSNDSIFERSCSYFNVKASDFQSLIDQPPNPAEITGAFKAVKSHKYIIRTLLPSNVQNSIDEHALDKQILQAEKNFELFFQDAVKSINFEQQGKQQQDHNNTEDNQKSDDHHALMTPLEYLGEDSIPRSNQHHGEIEWEALLKQNNYICGICTDLFAAPQILTCSHSFCWSCLHEYLDKCTSHDATTIVVKECPLCKQEIQNVTYIYERSMDETICSLTSKFPDTLHSKIEWQLRRAKYLEFKKKNEKGQGKGKNGPQQQRRAENDDFLHNLTIGGTVAVILAIVAIVVFRVKLF